MKYPVQNFETVFDAQGQRYLRLCQVPPCSCGSTETKDVRHDGFAVSGIQCAGCGAMLAHPARSISSAGNEPHE